MKSTCEGLVSLYASLDSKFCFCEGSRLRGPMSTVEICRAFDGRRSSGNVTDWVEPKTSVGKPMAFVVLHAANATSDHRAPVCERLHDYDRHSLPIVGRQYEDVGLREQRMNIGRGTPGVDVDHILQFLARNLFDQGRAVLAVSHDIHPKGHSALTQERRNLWQIRDSFRLFSHATHPDQANRAICHDGTVRYGR